MSQYYYYSKVLAQLNAIFYCSGLPEENRTVASFLNGKPFYNDYYDTKLDAFKAYTDYTPHRIKTYKDIFLVQHQRNLFF